MCLGQCSDPVVNSLKDIGYNVVRLPKADIRPNELLLRSGGSLNRIGGLSDLFDKGAVGLPPIGPDTPAADLNGKRTHDMNAGLGLTLLGSVIKALGGNLGFEAAYKDARSVAFEFSDTVSNAVKMIDVVKFINAASLSPFTPQVAKMLEADAIYVVTGTLKSTKITVEAKRDNSSAIKVDVPVIQQILGGNVKVSREAGSETKISYTGNIPLIFGVQAYHLFYDKGKFTDIKPAPASDGQVAALAGIPEGAELLTTEKAFVQVGEI